MDDLAAQGGRRYDARGQRAFARFSGAFRVPRRTRRWGRFRL